MTDYGVTQEVWRKSRWDGAMRRAWPLGFGLVDAEADGGAASARCLWRCWGMGASCGDKPCAACRRALTPGDRTW